MKLNANSILIGILAGTACAFLQLGAGQGALLTILLFAIAALPIFIAGLGWSNQAAIAAVATAFAILLAATSPQAAMVSAMTTLLPSAWLAHLTTLARPASEVGGPDDKLVWYPLPQLMLHAATLMVLTTLFIGWILNYTPETANVMIEQILTEMARIEMPPEFIESIDAQRITISKLFPMVQSAMWMIILFTAWYFAGAIVRMSNRSKRPRDNVHLTLRLPSLALIFLTFGLVLLVFFDGTISFVGAAITGGFGAAFMMAGLAVLHQKTADKMWRGIALAAAYISILFFSFPALIFIVVGVLEAHKATPMLVSQNQPEFKE